MLCGRYVAVCAPQAGRTQGVAHRTLCAPPPYVPSSGHFPLFLQLSAGFGLYNGAEATVSDPSITPHTPWPVTADTQTHIHTHTHSCWMGDPWVTYTLPSWPFIHIPAPQREACFWLMFCEAQGGMPHDWSTYPEHRAAYALFRTSLFTKKKNLSS